MLDLKIVRNEIGRVRDGIRSRSVDIDLDVVVQCDQQRRLLLQDVESLKSERNRVSKEIGALKKSGEDASAKQEAMRSVGIRINQLDQEIREVETHLHDLLLAIPNMPHESVPLGQDDAANKLVRTHGAPKHFSFTPRSHGELGEKLRLFDFERATRMSGAGFPLLLGQGARLERALIQFMLDLHIKEHGYTEIAPPLLCTPAAMTGTGQLPKMAEDVYHIVGDDLYLIPTAEVSVTNYYREEVIQNPLPLLFVAYTPCFRREAGAAGKDTRGLIRVHQFNKVEMVKFVEPDRSYDELGFLVKDAEDVLQRLGLHYRVRELCTGDLSFAAAKCYDIELWAPGQQDWLEVSSCSNFEAFQARRANIRYRNSEGKTTFVHTLNGSGVALPRLMVAILENGQEEDGSVSLPEALWPYMGGVQRLTA
ncbi:MAG: serine--tRNA ligase [Kiritimatiellae bacterium]|nr:serine--tRNA ligase [Kiritimatiellia bacterium]